MTDLAQLIGRLEEWERTAKRGCGPTWFQKSVGPLLGEAADTLRALQDQQEDHIGEATNMIRPSNHSGDANEKAQQETSEDE